MNTSRNWFRTSGQAWKVWLMWCFAATIVGAAVVDFWLSSGELGDWRTIGLGIASGVAAFVMGALVRCRICGERVVAALFLERPRSRFLDELLHLEECPLCGDPGDGSNPNHWKRISSRSDGPRHESPKV